MKEEFRKIQKMQNDGTVGPQTLNEEDLSFEVVFSKGTRGLRSSFFGKYYEELSLESNHVRLERLKNGAPVLRDHNAWSIDSVIGVVTDVRLENGQGIAKVRLDKGEIGSEIFRKVQDGILRKISVGYKVYKYEDMTEKGEEIKVYRAIDWEPTEVSLVAVAFDDEAQVRSSIEAENECIFIKRQEENMPEMSKEVVQVNVDEVRMLEQKRILDITKISQESNIASTLVNRFISENKSVEEVRSIVSMINENVSKDQSQKTSNISVEITRDEIETRNKSIESAILYRANIDNDLKFNASAYRQMSLIEMARMFCHKNDVQTLSKSEIATRALSVTDFGNILANVAGKSLRSAYELAPKTYQPFVNIGKLPDFKEVSRINFGAMPSLEKIGPGGEYKEGNVDDGAPEKYSLSKYGKIININDEVIINDDLSAFTRVPSLFGASAARLETKLVYSVLMNNDVMSDGKKLFDKIHKNIADKGATISDEALSFGRRCLREQKFGEDFLNLTPKFLVVGTSMETVAKKYLATNVFAPNAESINTFSGSLEPIVDPNITDNSWYLIAPPSMIDTIEVGYLEGVNGPEISQQRGFDVDGIRIKCKHIVGVKAIDWRGMFKNEGEK